MRVSYVSIVNSGTSGRTRTDIFAKANHTLYPIELR